MGRAGSVLRLAGCSALALGLSALLVQPAQAHTRALRKHPTITITESDEGHHYAITKGESVVVNLSAFNLLWSEPSSSNQKVLDRTSGSSGTSATATFLAAASGNTTVSAAGYPNCSTAQACPDFIVEFMVSITVS